MNQQYGKLSFQKRIKKINKKRPNSSFKIHSSYNNSINSTYGAVEGGRKKSMNNSCLTQFNNSCVYDNSFLLPSKNSSKINSEYYIATLKVGETKSNKILLYEDSIKLKTKINKLKKELALAKSDNRKKDEEIKRREKTIEMAKNKLKETNTFGNLKEENIIIQLKDNYQNLKSRINKQIEDNNQLFNDIKNTNLNELEENNINKLYFIKQNINEYNSNLQFNLDFNREMNLGELNRKEFINNHSIIEKMKKKLEEKQEKIYLLKENLEMMKEKLYQIEESRKRIALYNESIKKQNERLLIDKKKREDYILKKPIILGKINEYETKSKNCQDKNKNNEHEIKNLALEKQKIAKQMRDSEISKPIDYDKLIFIQKNPKENIDQRILLLESLIKESKERQNEFIEIFAYYDDYVKQKENYEIINNEAKMIEEKNHLNINNDNLDNLDSSSQKKFYHEKIDKNDNNKDKNEEEDNSRIFIPSNQDKKSNKIDMSEINRENENFKETETFKIINNEKKEENEEEKINSNSNDENNENRNELKEMNEKDHKDDEKDKYEEKLISNNNEKEQLKLNMSEDKKNKKLDERKEIEVVNKKEEENKDNETNKKEEVNNFEKNANKDINQNIDYLQKKDDFKKGNENNKAKNNQEEIIEKKEKGINTDNKEKKEGHNKNDDINEKNKEANNKGKKNDTNEKEQSENKDNKDNKERNNINDNENNDINNKNKLDKIENKKKIEKKLNQFKLVLSIILSVKNISTDKLENKLLKYKDLSNENLENNNDDKKAFFLNISKDILEVINIKNENDIKLLRKILNYLFEEKYQKNKEIFLNKVINDLVGKSKLTFKENEDEEHKLLGKVIQEYSVKSNEIVEKIKKDNKKILSYKNLKKYLKEEQLYIKNNKEKIELFKFFIYVLKKNSSLHDDNFSIFDFASEDIISFFSNILDIANDKIYEDSIANDGLSITDEDYKKIISNFVKDFNKLLKEKNMRIDQLLGEDNINMIVKEGKEINLINIYTFIDKLREKGLQLNDNLVISCIFARYQLDENQEDIDLNLLENDLQQISI